MFLDTPTQKTKGSKKLSIFKALTGSWEYSKICLSYKEGSSNLLNLGVNKSNQVCLLLGSMGLVTQISFATQSCMVASRCERWHLIFWR